MLTLILTVLETGSPRSRCEAIQCAARGQLLLTMNTHKPTHSGGGKRAPQGPFHKGTNSIMRVEAEGPTPTPSHWGLGFNVQILGHADIPSTVPLYGTLQAGLCVCSHVYVGTWVLVSPCWHPNLESFEISLLSVGRLPL